MGGWVERVTFSYAHPPPSSLSLPFSLPTGSSEEQFVRLHCAQTGEAIESSEVYPNRSHHSLYVQSLRGDPLHEHRFSILVNYRSVPSIDLLSP